MALYKPIEGGIIDTRDLALPVFTDVWTHWQQVDQCVTGPLCSWCGLAIWFWVHGGFTTDQMLRSTSALDGAQH